MRFRWPFGLVLLCAACAGAPPQGGAAGAPDPAGTLDALPIVRVDLPVNALIGYRQQLQLSSAQVVALDSIGEQLRAENMPLVQRIRAESARGGGMMTDTTGFGPLRENRGRAVEGVRELLTAEQRTQVCELFRERPGTAARSRQSRDQPARRGAQGQRIAIRPVWDWCDPSWVPATQRT